MPIFTVLMNPMARKTERAEASFVGTIGGRCGGLRSILSEVEVVAPTDATVLITGETGTGKEVIWSNHARRTR
jgi:transcriptional regulator with GAF, ATPase, and Fis domain